ncbi:MAG: aminodeoxychorismate synthase component I [Idiomarina sp.]|nr:aminodeoxychorismate synthase component I [Idiomarina sp.]
MPKTRTTAETQKLTLYALDYAQWCDTEALFAPFANEPWAMLLDSAAAEHPDSRFDILVRRPVRTVMLHADSLTVTPPLSAAHRLDTPLDLFATLALATAQVPEVHPEVTATLPFVGGSVGYLGYDVARTIERLPTLAVQETEIADAAFGIYHDALIIDHRTQQAFILCPAERTREAAIGFWQSEPRAVPLPFRMKEAWQSNLTPGTYAERIQRIHEYLKAGDCYQINLAQRFTAQYEGDIWQAYQRLRHANRAPFSAFLNTPETSVLSVSPERFLAVSHEGLVETRPIKGTSVRSHDPLEDQAAAERLKHSEKDQAENLMIVDLLRNDMSRVCSPGSVSVPELFKLESFSAVHHLVSTVRGRLQADRSAFDLMRAAFPGGSITGAPKVRAMEIIEELEPHRRSVYCGSIAYFSRDGQSDSSITIRTLCSVEDRLYCWAGGGIVIDSVDQAEYQETLDKVRRILPVLAANEPATDSLDVSDV